MVCLLMEKRMIKYIRMRRANAEMFEKRNVRFYEKLWNE